MDISVGVFVVCLAGAALVGLAIGLLVCRGSVRRHRQSTERSSERIESLEQELADASDESRRQRGFAEQLRIELDETVADSERLRGDLAGADEALQEREAELSVAKRQLEESQARFGDIVGLEAENATLRVLASRIPALEARLAELEPDGPQVIDLREGSPTQHR